MATTKEIKGLTEFYSAPETENTASVNNVMALDVFSLGVTLLEMTGKKLKSEPKKRLDPKNLKSALKDLEGKYPKLVKIVELMVEEDPKKRITIDEVGDRLLDLKINVKEPNEENILIQVKEIIVKKNIVIPMEDRKNYLNVLPKHIQLMFEMFTNSLTLNILPNKNIIEVAMNLLSLSLQEKPRMKEALKHCLDGCFLIQQKEFINAEEHFQNAINSFNEKPVKKTQLVLLLYFLKMSLFKITNNADSFEKTLKIYKTLLEEDKCEIKFLKKLVLKDSIKYIPNGLFEFNFKDFRFKHFLDKDNLLIEGFKLVNFLLRHYKNPEKLSQKKIFSILEKLPRLFVLYLYFENFWSKNHKDKKPHTVFIEGLIYSKQNNWENAEYAFKFVRSLQEKQILDCEKKRVLSFLANLYEAEILQTYKNDNKFTEIDSLYKRAFELGLFLLKETNKINEYIPMILKRIEEWQSNGEQEIYEKLAETGDKQEVSKSLNEIKQFIVNFNEILQNCQSLDFKT